MKIWDRFENLSMPWRGKIFISRKHRLAYLLRYWNTACITLPLKYTICWGIYLSLKPLFALVSLPYLIENISEYQSVIILFMRNGCVLYFFSLSCTLKLLSYYLLKYVDRNRKTQKWLILDLPTYLPESDKIKFSLTYLKISDVIYECSLIQRCH